MSKKRFFDEAPENKWNISSKIYRNFKRSLLVLTLSMIMIVIECL